MPWNANLCFRVRSLERFLQAFCLKWVTEFLFVVFRALTFCEKWNSKVASFSRIYVVIGTNIIDCISEGRWTFHTHFGSLIRFFCSHKLNEDEMSKSGLIKPELSAWLSSTKGTTDEKWLNCKVLTWQKKKFTNYEMKSMWKIKACKHFVERGVFTLEYGQVWSVSFLLLCYIKCNDVHWWSADDK